MRPRDLGAPSSSSDSSEAAICSHKGVGGSDTFVSVALRADSKGVEGKEAETLLPEALMPDMCAGSVE